MAKSVGTDSGTGEKYLPLFLRRLPETAVAAHRGIADQEIQSKTSQAARIEQTLVVAVHWILTSETLPQPQEEGQTCCYLIALSKRRWTPNVGLQGPFQTLCVKSKREGDRWPLNGKTSSDMASQEMFNPRALIFHSLPPFSFKFPCALQTANRQGSNKIFASNPPQPIGQQTLVSGHSNLIKRPVTWRLFLFVFSHANRCFFLRPVVA